MITSNTEVTTYNLCEQQHHYRFVENIEPRYISVNTPLGIGILGHDAFKLYYLEMMNGSTIDVCLKAARSVLEAKINWILENQPEDMVAISRIANLIKVFQAYAFHYVREPFKVIAVEKEYQTSINSAINYGIRLDLLVQWLKGEYAGEYVNIDHKFVYNFKKRPELEMDCQLPKYQKTLRDNGIRISHSYFNQVRYREMKDPKPSDLFRREKMESTPIEIKKIWSEQEETALRIYEKRDKPVRTMHLLTCRGCMFQGLCKAELLGLDTTKMRIADFQQSTYGYMDMTSVGEWF
jgi:hypothetical protein